MKPPPRRTGRAIRRPPQLYAAPAAVVAALLFQVASAQTVVDATWLGGTANHNTPASWGLTFTPVNGANGADYNWIIDATDAVDSVVTVSAAAAIRNLSIASGDTLQIANGQTLTLVGTSGTGTIANSGKLSLLASSSLTNLVLNTGTFTLSGAGSLVLSNSSNNRVYGSTGTETLVNATGHTISGAGQVGVNLISIRNEGTIVANQANNLVIDPNATGVINTGTLRATAGATLVVQNGSVANTGGIVAADDASQVTLSTAAVTGGTLVTSGTGKIRAANGSTLSGLTISTGSKVEVPNSEQLNISGTIVNNGTLALLASTSLTDVVVASGGAILRGGGTVSLSNSVNNRIYGASGTTVLLNEDNTISGAGQLGVNLLQLDNRGIVEANVSGVNLEVDPGTGGATNTGTLRAVSGGILRLDSGTFTNTGGTIHAAAGSRVDLAAAIVLGGTLSTSGTGVIRTASASTLGGTLTLTADSLLSVPNATSLTLLSSGTYTNHGTISLAASTSLTDLIISDGNVSLGGTGTVTLSNSVNNRIYGAVAANTLINTATHTIQGAGQIGVNQMGLINEGTIVANQAAKLTLDPGTAGVSNSGTLRAESGGTLRLQGGSYTNTATGTIRALGTGSVVEFSGATVTGGELFNEIGAALRNVSASTYSGITLLPDSRLDVLNATSATLVGTFRNQGVLALHASTSLTDVIVRGSDVRLEGGGVIAMSNSANNRIYGESASNRLVNVDNTIRGAGQIGVNQMSLLNQATIVADETNKLIIDPAAGGVENTGFLVAQSGGTLELQSGAFSNAGGTIKAMGSGSRVNFENATITGGTLATLDGGLLRNAASSTFTNVTLADLGVLQILNATSATFNGVLTNGGVIEMLASTSLTDFIVGASGLTLAGGIVDLSASANNRIYGTSGSTLLNDGGTIRGAGQLGVNLLRLDNRGTVEANLSGGTLTLDPGTSGFVNTGLMTATSGGILRLAAGSYANSGGTIAAAAASRVDLSGATISGGELGGGVIRNVSASTLNALTIKAGAIVELPNGTSLTLLGTINNQGTVQVLGSTSLTDLIIGTGGATLTGAGVVELSASANNRIYGSTGTVVLNNANNTIRGSGQLGVNQLTLQNSGTIEANQTAALTVNLAAAFTNQGTLRATAGGNLVFVDALTNAGAVFVDGSSTFTAQSTFTQSAGFTALAGGAFSSAGATLQANTGLFGAGTITGAVTSDGVIAPGANGNGPGIGQLIFNQTLTLQPNSLLHFELGGPTMFDRIQAPSVTLGGSLALTFASGFENSVLASHSFTLLSTTNSTGLTGTFAGLPNGTRLFTADGFGSFQVNYGANSLILSDFVAVPEPSTYLLIGAGALILALRARRRA